MLTPVDSIAVLHRAWRQHFDCFKNDTRVCDHCVDSAPLLRNVGYHCDAQRQAVLLLGENGLERNWLGWLLCVLTRLQRGLFVFVRR